MLIYFIAGCATSHTASWSSAADIPPPPIEAPEGHRWVLNEPLSDEFNGSELDRDKWFDHYPGWEGRVPGKFIPESIRVDDGTLQIRSHILDPSPMDLPMFINAVCEIYTWELDPLEANLRDDSRNTSYYDYIRSWKLEKIADKPARKSY